MNRKRIVFLMLALIVMMVIFCFSAQPSDVSNQTSGRIERSVETWVENTNLIQNEKKKDIKENLTFIVRKTAHFTIYTLLGICVMGFVSTYERKVWKKESVANGYFVGNAVCRFR